MKCEISYIKDSEYSEDVKNNLTKAHIDIANELYSLRWNNTDGKIGGRIFTYHPDSGLLTVGNNPTSKYFREASIKIASINKRWKNEDSSEESGVVQLVDVEGNPYLKQVSIDVRRSFALTLGETIEEVPTNSNFRYLLEDFNMSDITKHTDEFYNLVVEPLGGHDEVFDTMLDNVNTLLIRYLKQGGEDTTEKGVNLKNLRELRNLLKSKESVDEIKALSKYIIMSGHAVNHVQTKLDDITNKLQNLPTDSRERENVVAEVSKYLKQASYYYHLFAPLEDISLEFDRYKVNPDPMNNYYRDVLEKELSLFMEELGLDESQRLPILNSVPERITDPNLIYNDISDIIHEINPQYTLTEVHRANFDRALKVSENPYKSLHSQLIANVNSFRQYQHHLKSLHYDVVTDMLHPIMEHVIEDKSKEFKDKAYDKKWILDKKDFKAYLQLADKDISVLPFWFSAVVNTDDLLARTVAIYFKQIKLYADMEFKKNAGDLQDFLIKSKVGGKKLYELSEKQQDEIHDTMVYDSLIIDNFIPVDPSYEGESITSNVLGIERKYKARKARFYVGEFDVLSFHNKEGVLKAAVDDFSSNAERRISEDLFSLRDLENSTDEYLKDLHKDLYYYSEFDKSWLPTKRFKDAVDEGLVRRFIKNQIQVNFYSKNLTNKSGSDRNKILKEAGIIDDSGNVLKIDTTFLKSSARKKRYNPGSFSASVHGNPSSLFSITFSDVVDNKYLVQYTDGTYDFVNVDSKNNPIIPEDKYIDYIFYNKGVLTSFSEEYQAENSLYSKNWSRIQNTPFMKSYYEELYSLYKKSNDKLGDQKLNFREIQQVPKATSKLDNVKNIAKNIGNPDFFVKGVSNFFEKLTIEQDSEPLKDINGNYTDVDGNILPTGAPPVYVSRVGMNVDGTKKRSVPIRFRNPIPLEELDKNLYRSLLVFNSQAEDYSILKQHQPTVQLLQTILLGDTKLKIDPRKAGVIDEKGNSTLQAGIKKIFTKNNPLVTEMVDRLINDTFYNEEIPDFNLGGVSAKRIVEGMTQITAYMSLAWNVSTMIPNYSISLINEKSVSIGNQFWNKKNYEEGKKEYWKAVARGDFFRDFTKKGFPTEKSFLTQLAVYQDAIVGEFMSPSGKIDAEGVADKMMNSALYWTMEMVEHANQLQSMIMLMKGHNIKDENGNSISVWDAFEQVNKGRKDGDRLVIPSYYTQQQQIDFHRKLQGVNRMIHGNYAKMDKNMLQHTIMGPVFMLFRKWIYDGFRARFQGEDLDYEIQDVVEGYFSSYLKDINKEFYEVRKNAGLKQAILKEGWKAVPKTWMKMTLAGVDSMTGRVISNNSDAAHKFLYRESKSFYEMNENERKLYAMHRASYEIGVMMMLLIVGTGFAALKDNLDDDDEEAKKVLSFLEVQSRRIANDLGFFNSFTNIGGLDFPGMVTFEQFLRITKDPMVSYRTVDATAGILAHLTNFSYDEEGMHWGLFDQYSRDGGSYKKGDYKIIRKIEKSVVSPYWQIIKLFNPDDQLKYMDMMFKYSK